MKLIPAPINVFASPPLFRTIVLSLIVKFVASICVVFPVICKSPVMVTLLPNVEAPVTFKLPPILAFPLEASVVNVVFPDISIFPSTTESPFVVEIPLTNNLSFTCISFKTFSSPFNDKSSAMIIL